MLVTNLSDRDRTWVRERTELLFGGHMVVSGEVVHQPAELPGFICCEGSERVGLATFQVDGDSCELVTIDALCQWCGVGSALLEAVEKAAVAAGCTSLWTITTNDNLNALRFYQKRGFRLVAVHRGAVNESRRIKPEIPLIGFDGIPLTDEIELEYRLD